MIINTLSLLEANSNCLVYISMTNHIARHVLSRAKNQFNLFFLFMNFFNIFIIVIIIIESTVSGHSLNQSVLSLTRYIVFPLN